MKSDQTELLEIAEHVKFLGRMAYSINNGEVDLELGERTGIGNLILDVSQQIFDFAAEPMEKEKAA